MIVYRDKLSGDEMLSDGYKLEPVLDNEGAPIPGLMQCASQLISKSGDVDIGCGNEFGGNADDDGPVDNSEKVNNVIDAFQYTETSMSTATDLKSFLKEYMNKIRQHMRDKGKPKEEIQAFMATAPGIAKYLVSHFNDLQFFYGPSFNIDTMVYAIYHEGALTPNFLYIMAGYDQEKF
mmetsp:Transcript_19138/g.19268  ORF Transcript_19138/g.19268 Transcript_19138/m.19268 type:complete len:178 (+) Transcript_19138:90-623(+)|eukprot:CAMPEP_0182427086 /NCGR_PEP_ID=MMETSP1167-20130531/14376_1 /TAXON_ID=2988 /ORGANISM="Mallomonas Sp, Strain CCMP3275" /LENGTH=177 /DNA_ID=CAMNT_0024608993 /DNA_START=90 /DNA_END=623 /DNA_ORIENTATION=+